MSTKLSEALRKSRETFALEKEKFLDALANFIENYAYEINHNDNICFSMKTEELIDGPTGKSKCEFAFSFGSKDWLPTFELAISEDAVIEILEEDCFATVTPLFDKESGEAYYQITICD